jgi:hypothetical protein
MIQQQVCVEKVFYVQLEKHRSPSPPSKRKKLSERERERERKKRYRSKILVLTEKSIIMNNQLYVGQLNVMVGVISSL